MQNKGIRVLIVFDRLNTFRNNLNYDNRPCLVITLDLFRNGSCCDLYQDEVASITDG